MELKWFFFIGFIFNVFGLSTPSGNYLIPKNVSIETVVLSLHNDKSLLESLQAGPSAFALLFGKATPDVIHQMTGFLADLHTESSTALDVLHSEVDVADANFVSASTALESAQLLKDTADSNLEEQGSILVNDLDSLQESIDNLLLVLDSSYTLVFRQTLPKYFVNGETQLNADDSENANYAILDDLELYRNDDGLFYFRLMWPRDPSVVYEWSQSSNPVLQGINGYTAIKIPYTGRYWGGLEPSDYALMDGSVNHGNWFYAVGSYQIWTGGIPAYAKTDDDFTYPQQEVELYAWKKP